jgi:putative hydrolase of HD superfamily
MSEPSSDLLPLLRTFAGLKRLRRTGWVDRGVPPDEVESVADHSLLTALTAWLAAAGDMTLDRDRVLKLALVHDLAEALIGDAPPYEASDVPDRADPQALRAFFSVRHLRSPENAAAKRAAELEAVDHLLALMPAVIAPEFRDLWEEYSTQTTPESRFVKQVDRLEAFLQACRYASDHPDLPLWGFTDMAEKEIEHPILVAIRDAAHGDPAPGEP